MQSTLNQTVGELAATIPGAIRVFEKYGIDYCCRGGTAVPDACRAAGITVGELEAELTSSAVAPEEGLDWTKRSLTDLHAYLVARFHVHGREELETINMLATKVAGVHGQRHPETIRVAALAIALQEDMLPHMIKEEMVLFPYVEALENGDEPASCFGTVENPIRVMLREHESVGELLRDLRVTTGGFTPPEDACFSYGELYRRLTAFERETHEHIHLENNVYFPKALQLERSR